MVNYDVIGTLGLHLVMNKVQNDTLKIPKYLRLFHFWLLYNIIKNMGSCYEIQLIYLIPSLLHDLHPADEGKNDTNKEK